MKKAITILLALVMVLSIAACGGGSTTTNTPAPTEAPATPEPVQKSQDVINVEALIDSIGTVTAKSGAIIEKAEKEYSYLRDSDKEKVENYSALLRAKDEFEDVFLEYIIGDWSYQWTAQKDYRGTTKYDNYSKGDVFTETYTLEKAGLSEWKKTNKTKGNTTTKDNPNWNITWELSDGMIVITERYWDGLTEQYSFEIDIENDALIETETGHIYNKVS